jgi:membrane-associated protease RseP (regulator of RpoE activity)
MKRVLMGALGLLAVVGPANAQRLTDQERRELETKLEQVRREMRVIELKLGRTGVFRLLPDAGSWAYSINLGRPRLGVTVRTEPDPATDSIGAVLQAVTPGGPAAEAGLEAGDIVLQFNGEALVRPGRVTPGNRLIELSRELEEGDSARVRYRRGRDTRNATVVARKLNDMPFAYTLRADTLLGLMPEMLNRVQVGATRLGEPVISELLVGFGGRWTDMELTTLDTELGSYFGTTEGLLVVRAPRDSLLGLKSGDVILRIGGRVPSNPSHAVRILRSYEPGDQIRVDIMRNRRQTELTATVPVRERGAFWDER